MKQTAVEFLQECLSIHLNHKQQMQFEGLFQQAKAMHKQQIIDAYETSHISMMTSEQYYNETYND